MNKEQYTIVLVSTFNSIHELSECLEHIKKQINEGFTSGFNPTWYLHTIIK